MTTSGISTGKLINCTCIPTALKADWMAASVGVSAINPAGGRFSPEGGRVGFGRGVPRFNTPTPITCMSRWLAILDSFCTVQLAALNNGRNCLAKLKLSSPPPDVYPKLIVPPGRALSAATKSVVCAPVNVRGLMRSWSSRSLSSAVAALVCCLAISALASAASCSSPATRASALAARSCCLPSAVFASVNPLSNCLICSACRPLMMFPVISTPAPNANARNNKTTAPTSKKAF
jgi:hypothetical protein